MPITINGTGSITGISAGGLPDASITSDDIAAGAITAAKIGYAGAILQVVQATTTDTASGTTGNTDVDLFSANITPKQSNSNIFVMVNYGMGHGNNATWYLKRGSTKIAGTGKSSTFIHADSFLSMDEDSVHSYSVVPTHYQYLDTGRTAGTGQITYTLGCRMIAPSNLAFYFNRADADATTSAAYTATFILMEVAA